MKYYLAFINKTDGFKVVAISSYDDYDSQQEHLVKFNARLQEYGLDWLAYPEVEYHEIQAISEL